MRYIVEVEMAVEGMTLLRSSKVWRCDAGYLLVQEGAR